MDDGSTALLALEEGRNFFPFSLSTPSPLTYKKERKPHCVGDRFPNEDTFTLTLTYSPGDLRALSLARPFITLIANKCKNTSSPKLDAGTFDPNLYKPLCPSCTPPRAKTRIRTPTCAGREISLHTDHLSPTTPLAVGKGRQEAEQVHDVVSMGAEAEPVSSSSFWGGACRAGPEARRVREGGPRRETTQWWRRQGWRSTVVGQHGRQGKVELRREPAPPSKRAAAPPRACTAG